MYCPKGVPVIKDTLFSDFFTGVSSVVSVCINLRVFVRHVYTCGIL